MPRRPRELVKGGIYHVYNRFANGQPIFELPEACDLFLRILREVKSLDRLTVFAWCLMSNHYHLAVRMHAVPLSRGMRRLDGRFSQAFNTTHGRYGPLWQGRYKCQLVRDSRYLQQLILYIHLNPVRAGLTSHPSDHVLNGHYELASRCRNSIIDADDSYLAFGESLQAARHAYLSSIDTDDPGDFPPDDLEALPWWKREDRSLEPRSEVLTAELERINDIERPQVSAGEFLVAACELLRVDVNRLASRRRDSETAALRRMVATLGIERWSQRAVDIARTLGKNPDVVSTWATTGARTQRDDVGYKAMLTDLDRRLSESLLARRRDIPRS